MQKWDMSYRDNVLQTQLATGYMSYRGDIIYMYVHIEPIVDKKKVI